MYFEKSSSSIIQRTKIQSPCFPCFSGSPVEDSDDPEQAQQPSTPAAQAGSKRKLSTWFSSGLPKRESKKKKYQPVDVPSAAPGKNITAGPNRPKETPAAQKSLYDEKPFPGQNLTASIPGEIFTSKFTRPQPTQPTAPSESSPISKNPSYGSRSKRRNRPISLDHSAARTAGFAPLSGLCVLAATLAVLVFFGRASAVICLCSCFYVLQLARAMEMTAAAAATAETRRVSREAYMDSSEYKKRVVVEGLLERSSRRFDGRRTSSHLLPLPNAS